MEFTVVGAGAIGGTVGARMVRDGHDVLFCDIDRAHVEAMNETGLRIEGPIEQVNVRVRAVTPEDLPRRLPAVILAVKAPATAPAMTVVAPRLDPEGYVLTLQNGLTFDEIAAAVGAPRTVVGFVNFGADYMEPGRIHYGGRGAFFIGELDGSLGPRIQALVAAIAEAKPTQNILGYRWAKQAYGAMLYATAVTDLSIADALAEPGYRDVFVTIAQEALAQSPVEPESFDGFDPHDLDGSIERLVDFNRRSAKSHSGVYRDLMVRKRKTEVDQQLGPMSGLVIERTTQLIHAIEDGSRTCERANLDLLAAYEAAARLGSPLNAILDLLPVPERKPDGPLRGLPVAVKDNIDIAGRVTTCASTVGNRLPARADASVVKALRDAGAEVFCKTNLLEFAAGAVNDAFGMTYNPMAPGRTSGGSSGGSAAVVAAGACRFALGTDTGGSVRIPASYCGIVGLKPTYGLLPLEGVFPLSPTCDHVGTLTRNVADARLLLQGLTGSGYGYRGSLPGAGVLVEQLEHPRIERDVSERIQEGLARLESTGVRLVDTRLKELADANECLGTIVLKEAYQQHKRRLDEGERGYGPDTLKLLLAGEEITEADYREALAERERIRDAFLRSLDDTPLLIGPTVLFPAPEKDPPFDGQEGALEALCTGPYCVVGLPAISIPCGLTSDGLPVGLQIASGPGTEALLLHAATAHERAMAR